MGGPDDIKDDFEYCNDLAEHAGGCPFIPAEGTVGSVAVVEMSELPRRDALDPDVPDGNVVLLPGTELDLVPQD